TCVASLGLLCIFLGAPAIPDISPLSLHDALPISKPIVLVLALDKVLGRDKPLCNVSVAPVIAENEACCEPMHRSTISLGDIAGPDRKSTRLNSSHVAISYAVFCLKKKTIAPFPAA